MEMYTSQKLWEIINGSHSKWKKQIKQSKAMGITQYQHKSNRPIRIGLFWRSEFEFLHQVCWNCLQKGITQSTEQFKNLEVVFMGRKMRGRSESTNLDELISNFNTRDAEVAENGVSQQSKLLMWNPVHVCCPMSIFVSSGGRSTIAGGALERGAYYRMSSYNLGSKS